MRRKGKHLSYTDRLTIEKLFNRGKSRKEIAEIMECHLDTVYREIRRGLYDHLNSDYTLSKRYSADIAQMAHDQKASLKGAALKIGNNHALAEYIERKIIHDHYSPYAVLGEIYLVTGKKPFCVSTLYSYIEKGVFLHLTNKQLQEKTSRKRQYKKVVKAKRAPAGKSIERRPKEISSRKSFGHWEMDTVKGKAKGKRQTVLVLTERKTRFEIMVKLHSCSARSVVRALDKLKIESKLFKTITVDNGGEFSDAYGIEHDACGHKRTEVYYCHPYSSTERASNERQNRIIRRFHPKGQSLYRVTNAELQDDANWINNYPRKIFGYKTSAMLFRECCEAENISPNFRIST